MRNDGFYDDLVSGTIQSNHYIYEQREGGEFHSDVSGEYLALVQLVTAVRVH